MNKIGFRSAVVAVALLLAACGSKDKSADTTAAATSNSAAPAAAAAPIPAPAGGWAEVVSKTADGGFVMGNPNAAVKLVEYGSLTCPHCAEFSKTAADQITTQYVGSGRVSYEYRNFVRDPYDLAAALIVRCAGPAPFFKTVEQLYLTQEDWVGRIEKLSKDEQTRLTQLPPTQMFPALAQAMGLDTFMAQRGLPSAKAQACLTDTKASDELIAMRDKATNQLNVMGTPTFFINGATVDGADWVTLQTKLNAALGS